MLYININYFNDFVDKKNIFDVQEAADKKEEEDTDIKDNDEIEVGMRFVMGDNVYYSVESINEYILCKQITDLKNDSFPSEIMLSKTQIPFTKTLTNEAYSIAIDEYKKNKPAPDVSVSVASDINIKVGVEFKMGNITLDTIGMIEGLEGMILRAKRNAPDTDDPAIRKVLEKAAEAIEQEQTVAQLESNLSQKRDWDDVKMERARIAPPVVYFFS